MKNIQLRAARLFAALALGSWTLPLLAQTVDPGGFTCKMDIAFSGCGVAAPAALTNFPALVVFDPAAQPTFSYTGFASPETGADLRFADASGAEIPYEIDTWDAAGRSLIWVRVPAMHGGASVTAYWGADLEAPVYAGADNVWANGYVGVWHGSSAAMPSPDSSPMGNHMTAREGAVALAANAAANSPGGGGGGAGAVGKVFDFGAGGERWLSAPDDPSLNNFSALTVEVMAYDTFTAANAARGILSKRADGSNGRVASLLKVSADISLDIAGQRAATAAGYPHNTWTHLLMTFDGGIANQRARVNYYRNGAWAATPADTDIPASSSSGASPLYLGILNAGDGRAWEGQLDEVRISNVARSPAWIAASHATMAAPLAFASYGDAVAANPGLPAIATLPAVVGADNVALRGILASQGGSPATVTTYWWREGGAATNAVSPARAPAENAEFSDTLTVGIGGDLNHARAYNVRHHAANTGGASAWSPKAVAFTTLGAPVLGAPSAVASSDSATLSATLCDAREATSVAVECRIGASPDALNTVVKTWTGLAAGDNGRELVCAANGLGIGETYYYAFFASGPMSDDPAHSPVVSTPVGSFSTTGVSTWIEPASGDWRDPANWDAGVPGPAARANFQTPGATIAATSSLVVSQAMANASGLVAFDLAGNTLFVAERFDIGGNPASPQHPAAGDSAVRLLNGEFDLSAATLNLGGGPDTLRNSLAVGSNATLRAKNIRIGLDTSSQPAPANNTLTVAGPNAALHSETIAIGAASHSFANMLLVQDAALTNSSTMQIGGAESTDRSLAVFRNSRVHNKGSVWLGYHNWTDDAMLAIEDGTRFDIGGELHLQKAQTYNGRLIVKDSTLNVAGRIYISDHSASDNFRFIIEGPGAEVNAGADIDGVMINNGSDALIIIDRGALNIKNGMQIGTWNGQRHGVIISNGTLKVGSALRLCAGDGLPRGNYIELHGPDAKLTTWSLAIGDGARVSGDNHIRLNGGLLTAAGSIALGSRNCSNTLFAVSSPTSKLAADTLSLANNARLAFDLPEEGFTHGVAGASVIELSGALALDATSSIEINAGEFTGRARLVSSAPGLPDLSGKIKVSAARGIACKIIIPPDNSHLEINCVRSGTLLLVK